MVIYMKKNKMLLITLLLIFGLMIIYLIYYKNFNYPNNKMKNINSYINRNYELTDSEKEILTERIKNKNFFDKYKDNIEQYVDVRINIDSRDGLAWGSLTLTMDKNIEEEIEKILQQTNKTISTDSRVYGIVDDYGSICIEPDFSKKNSEKIKLIFFVKLPYRYKSINDYNKFIKFFLKFDC